MHPEPKKEIWAVFFGGVVGVVVAVVLESGFFGLNGLVRNSLGYGFFAFQLTNIIGFSIVEESVKTASAYFTGIRSRYFDEPVDAMVYLVTAALGFAALENVFFVAESLKAGVGESLIVSAFRFINASLLHVSASAIVGSAFAFSFFRKERLAWELALGMFFAVVLHAFYNFLIVNSAWTPSTQMLITLLVIAGASLALVLFERARRAGSMVL